MAKVDKIVKTYKTLTQVPVLLSANIDSNNVINSIWSQRNIEKGKSTKFVKSLVVSNDFKTITQLHPIDVSDELLSRISASNKYRAVLRELDNKQFLEIWQTGNLIRSVDLNTLDVHGAVYADVEFSALEWSPDEKRILYVAEKKIPKSEPFYTRKAPSDDGSGDKIKTKGDEYLYRQDWGEQLVGKKYSILAQYDIENDTVEILEGVPEDKCVAAPKYSPNGSHIVGVAYKTEPRKLGLIFCTNRPSTLFKLDFEGNYVELNSKNNAVRSPIFSPDGKSIFWMQRNSGGPHATCMSLMKTEWPISENSEVKTVVDVVEDFIKIENNVDLYGLYNSGFVKRCWASSNRLIVNSNQKYAMKSYIVNLDNGKITELAFAQDSLIILDIFNDIVLASKRSCVKQDCLLIGKIPPTGQEKSIKFEQLTSDNKINGLENTDVEFLDFKAPSGDFVNFNAIYLGPKSGDKNTVPLIVYPHGGPHSAFSNVFMLDVALFLSSGYALALVNYRGSLGIGKKCVDYLPSRAGTADVEDCMQVTTKCLELYPWLDPKSLLLYGGSHGGFLVAHLSGQYPDTFKAVVSRNPVTDLASMSIISDIPDWCYIEGGNIEYSQKGAIIDSEFLKTMRNMSPIIHAHKVKAPTLLQLGSKDLRVPSHQGTEYYHRLKANDVTVRMNLYDDNHSLSSVPNEMDNVINSLLWFDKHTGRTE